MKTLRRASDRAEIMRRIRLVRPDSRARWGRMTAPQMICHLTDVFHAASGDRSTGSSKPPKPAIQRVFLRVFALYLPVRWPHGVKTRPGVDQEIGGTPPGEFEDDVNRLERACDRFLSLPLDARPFHYMFGRLSDAEWCRWGYRHIDHHLRQFGITD